MSQPESAPTLNLSHPLIELPLRIAGGLLAYRFAVVRAEEEGWVLGGIAETRFVWLLVWAVCGLGFVAAPLVTTRPLAAALGWVRGQPRAAVLGGMAGAILGLGLCSAARLALGWREDDLGVAWTLAAVGAAAAGGYAGFGSAGAWPSRPGRLFTRHRRPLRRTSPAPEPRVEAAEPAP